jgi:aspartyl-tRNA(Asn)/glutamyl-tRNA(Gln) amidotransferase subunit C
MAKVTKEEVLKLAQMSHIKIHEHEIEPILNQLENVLNYAARVQEIATHVTIEARKNINVMREDVIVKFDADLILSRAPETEEHFFIVPAILESNK